MAISDLSTEEKIKLSEMYKELNNIVKQKEELNVKTTPLCEKLDELKSQEAKLDTEYSQIFYEQDSFSSEQTSRLSEITDRLVEISNEKEQIMVEIRKLSTDVENVKKEESSIREYIEAIAEKKEGSLFSLNDEVVKLDKDGNVVEKIEVDASNFSNIKNSVEHHVNRAKNTITKTSPKVLKAICDNCKKVKKFTYELNDTLKDKISFMVTKVKETTDEIKNEVIKGYKEEEQRVQNVLDEYNRMKNEQEKIELEASNLEFANVVNKEDNNQIENSEVITEQNEEVQNNINENLYYPSIEDQQAKEEGFIFTDEPVNILPADSIEVEEAKTINVDEVINTIDNNQIEEQTPEVSQDETKTVEASSEETELTSESITEFKEKDQFVQTKYNKIAKSTKSKLVNMTTLFGKVKQLAANIGKKAAEFKTNIELNNAKNEAKKELDEKNNQEINNIKEEMKAKKAELEELQRKQIEDVQKNYDSQLDELESIFDGQSLAA